MRCFYLGFLLLIIAQSGYNQNSIKSIHNQALGNISTLQAIDDVQHLINRLEEVHYNPYLHISKEQLNDYFFSIKKDWTTQDSITKSEFIIEFMKFISKIDDGHSKLVWYSTEVLPFRDSIRYFPLELKLNNKKLTVQDTFFSKEVHSINGHSAIKLYQEAMECLAGNYEYKNEINSTLFFPTYLYLKGLFPPYQINLSDGAIINIDKNSTLSFFDLYARLHPKQVNYDFDIIADQQVGILNYYSCTDYDSFEIFLSNTFKELNEKHINNLIIDIRQNSGGDSSLNDILLSYITRKAYRQSSKRIWKISDVSIEELESREIKKEYGADYLKKFTLQSDSTLLSIGSEEAPIPPMAVEHFFNGNCYLLIGPKTYSSANMLADAISNYNICTIVGQSTGERTNDFGEQKTEFLPNSNLPFDYTIAFDIGADGDENSIKTVNPDIYVEGDAKEYVLSLIRDQ